MTLLRATTWDHARGVAPLAAAGQIFADRHPGLRFEVVPHSGRQFGEGPLEALARDFDLIVFDHPLTGLAAEQGLLLPLEDHLSSETIDDRRRHSVGASFESYVYRDRVWGLPLDAACIAAAVRPDLLEKVPGDLEGVIELAAEGRVAQGFSRMTATALFYLFGGRSEEQAEKARENLHRLFKACGSRKRLEEGSMHVLEAATSGEDIAFIPACYAYSNYVRHGFARHPLRFLPTPLAPTGAVLGGAGIAVSASSGSRELALEFVEWVTAAECQTFVYAVCGGQPAHATAWEADLPNHLTGEFYRELRPAMQSAWRRPNHPDFHHEQSELATRLQKELTRSIFESV